MFTGKLLSALRAAGAALAEVQDAADVAQKTGVEKLESVREQASAVAAKLTGEAEAAEGAIGAMIEGVEQYVEKRNNAAQAEATLREDADDGSLADAPAS